MVDFLSKDVYPGYDESRFPIAFLLDYEALECLGQNEYSETLLVRSRSSDIHYVAKCYNNKSHLSQEVEETLLRSIRHKGIPCYLSKYQNDEMLCIVREYVHGWDLVQIVQDISITSMDQIIDIASELCDILTFLHGYLPPIIHRDIKPQNIIMNLEGQLYLIDFGISRFYQEEATSDTACYGTRGFAAPEQYGFAQTDGRSDLYSLGMVTCWLLTGKADRSLALATIRNRKMKRILRKATEFAPEKRYSSAAHLKKALSKVSRKRKLSVFQARSVLLLCILFFCIGVVTGNYMEKYPMIAIDQGVQFEEPLIEEAIRLQLDKSEDSEIYEDELLKVTEIYIFGNKVAADREAFDHLTDQWAEKDKRIQNGGIRSLRDIEKLNNVKTVEIVLQNITDVSALGSLSRLEEINLKHNPIKEVSAFRGLLALRSLDLYDTAITDLSELSECSRLDNLVVGVTDIRSVKAFAGIKKLCYLHASGVTLDTLRGIEQFPYLQELSLYGVEDKDLTPLLSLPQLKKVALNEGMRDDAEQYLANAEFRITYTE